jgi:hypothetical protein
LSLSRGTERMSVTTHIGNRIEGFVFTTKNGTPWNADLVLKRHLRGRQKVTNGHLHMFRHTFATGQLQAGAQRLWCPRFWGTAAFQQL